MLAFPIDTAAASTEMATAALITAAAIMVGALMRAAFCLLIVVTARKALADADNVQNDANEVRAHRLAVLQTVLTVFTGRYALERGRVHNDRQHLS
jgi:hypothetical protein